MKRMHARLLVPRTFTPVGPFLFLCLAVFVVAALAGVSQARAAASPGADGRSDGKAGARSESRSEAKPEGKPGKGKPEAPKAGAAKGEGDKTGAEASDPAQPEAGAEAKSERAGTKPESPSESEAAARGDSKSDQAGDQAAGEAEESEDSGAADEETPAPSQAPTASPTAKAEQKSEVIRFGLILPLTGPSANWGKNMRNAAMLAFEDLEPETRKKMSLIFEDDQLKGANAVSAFNKLVEVDKVKGMVVFGGQSVAPVAPLAEKKEIPFFAITANKEPVKGKLFAFRHWLDSSEQVRVLIPFLQEKDVSNVAIVVVSHEAMLDYVTKFAVAAAQGGIDIASKEEVTPQEADFKTIVAKLKEQTPDGIMVVLLPPQLSLFAKKLRDAGIDAPLFGFANTETMSEVKAAAGAMDGMIYTAPKLSKDFVKRFQERFEDFPELATGNVYDMVKIYGAAVKSGADEPKAIANFLRRLKDYQGVLGTYSISEDNDFQLKADLKKIKRGSFRLLDEQ